MAFRRRARIAKSYPGLRVDAEYPSAIDLMAYEGLISVFNAETVLANAASTPEDIGRATRIVTGSAKAGMIAEAKARLAEAARRKGF